MTKLLSGDEFLQLVARKDTKVFAVTVKGSRYECEYQTTPSDTGHIAPVLERVLRRIPGESQNLRSGNQGQVCEGGTRSGYDGIDECSASRETNSPMETGHNPADENMAQSGALEECSNTGTAQGSTQPNTASNPQQGTGRSGEPDSANQGPVGTHRTKLDSEGQPRPERVKDSSEGTQDHVRPTVLVKHYDPMNGYMDIPEDIYNALNGLFRVCQQKKQNWIQKQIQKRSMLCPNLKHNE